MGKRAVSAMREERMTEDKKRAEFYCLRDAETRARERWLSVAGLGRRPTPESEAARQAYEAAREAFSAACRS